MKKCPLYLVGLHFKLVTNHVPLVSIHKDRMLNAFENFHLLCRSLSPFVIVVRATPYQIPFLVLPMTNQWLMTWMQNLK